MLATPSKFAHSARHSSHVDKVSSESKPLQSMEILETRDQPALGRTEAKNKLFGFGRNASFNGYAQPYDILPTNQELELMKYSEATGDVRSLFDFT